MSKERKRKNAMYMWVPTKGRKEHWIPKLELQAGVSHPA